MAGLWPSTARLHHRPWHEANSPRSAWQGQMTGSKGPTHGPRRGPLLREPRAESREETLRGCRGGPERYATYAMDRSRRPIQRHASPRPHHTLGITGPLPSAMGRTLGPRPLKSRVPPVRQDQGEAHRLAHGVSLQRAGHAARLTRWLRRRSETRLERRGGEMEGCLLGMSGLLLLSFPKI